MTTKLCSLEMGEENKKNCATWSVHIPGLSQLCKGVWGAAPALHRSGVWGKAPCPPQEQGFKGLAPLCINNHHIYMEGGLGCSPKALHRSGVWGNAPCSLQEQGFKGLAPWCINNHHISYLSSQIQSM